MPVDPQIQILLERGSGVPATHTLPVAEARRLYEARIAAMAKPAGVADVAMLGIDGPGGPLAVRLYTPHGQGPFPLMVFFHGSGFVLCSLDTHDSMCRNLAAGIGCVVASVDYRLAPEHKFPAGPDDCLVATRWLGAHAAEIGADPSRIMVTALRLRDEGGPGICGQMLLYPVTDYHTPGTPSYAENADGYGLTRSTMEWFWHHYLGDPAEAGNPHASPLRAPSLERLPPAYVVSAEYDPLRDEAERYGERLRDAGVPVEIVRCAGMNHGFLFWVGIVDGADKSMAAACAWARRTFGKQ